MANVVVHVRVLVLPRQVSPGKAIGREALRRVPECSWYGPVDRRADGRVVVMTRLRREGTADLAREIAPDVFCLGPWGRTQTDVYFVRSGSSWVLIDAGWGQ